MKIFQKGVLFLAAIWGTCAILLLISMNINTPQQLDRTNPKPPKQMPQSKFPEGSRGSIVRLHDPETGRFFCSGVVISRRMIVTAAHCVGDASKGDIVAEIRDHTKQRTGIIATLKAANHASDVAIVRGNFKQFATRQAHVTTQSVLSNIENNGREIVTCGYPWSGELVCIPMTNREQFAFQISGDGYLYPGMSGGPVIDVLTGTVIGVNSAVYKDKILISPLVELYASLDTSPE